MSDRDRSVMIDLALIERLRADQMVQEHVCCPACVRVADLLAAEGKHDPLYDKLNPLNGRCCCRAPILKPPTVPQAEGEL
ncbi:MAG: hypothetical protein NUW01_12450 [Gemmatimonadaceae bacterium]|nr:hypothetical protein [Gemmatimonadaceae bacterium]